MAFLLKHVDKTTVNYDTSFTYTIQASFNGLTLPEINPAVLVDTVPSYIELDFSAVDPVITYSVQTVGLNKVITFNFPPVTDTGIAYEIDLICKFKDGTLNGSTCTNNAQLYLAGSDTPSFTAIAPTVTLSIKAKWDIDKLMTSPVNNNPTPGGYAYYSIFLKNLGDRGAALNNFTIKDTLPAGMTLDPLFVPVVMNQGGGILNPNPPTYVKDPGDTGITWSITQYTGNNLLLIIKVNIDKNVALNTDLTNNVKLIDSEGNVLDYSNQTSKVTSLLPMTGVSKYGPNHSYAGALISYEIYIQNNGNTALTNLVVIDTIPANVTIEKVFPGNFSIRGLGTFPAKTFHLFYTTDDYSVVNPSWTEIGVGFPYGYNPYWTYYNLPTTPNKATRLKWEFPDADIDFTQSDAPRLNGVVDPTAEPTDTAVNVVNYYADQISPAQTDFTTYLDGVAEINGSKYNHPSGSVIPTDTINYEGFINAWASPIVNPIIVDLLPIEVEYIGNVSVSYAEYFSNQWVWTTLNPVIGSGPQIIVTSDENYNNTGRTRVRIEINPFVLTQRSLMSIRFDTTVKPGVTNTIQNNMLIGNEGKSIAYPPYLDTTDQDGDGITNEQLLITNTVYNNVLFSTKYASDKKVKGALDTNYTQWPDVGNTYNGGPAAKLLPVEPEKVGIQVKLPGKDTVTLGDFVWIDENHDGIYDNGEVGINGAVINLYDSNKVFISTTTTTYDSNNNPGYYSFKNIDPGEYYIEFIPPDGYVLTVQKANEQNGSKPDRTTGFTDLITTVTTPGSIDMTIDAGVYPSNLLSSVGDLVWIDSNKNGVYDPGEKGQAGVVVTLYDENGVRTDYSAITDSNGKYLIDKVIPQKYYAVFSNIPQDYLFVTAKGYVTNTGVTPKLIDVPSGTFVDTVDAPIAFNDGLIGPPGLPGPSGCCYTYNILNSIYLDNQEVKRGCTVNLGCSAVNNGEFSSYENNSNYVILNGEGTFMIDYSCYGEFLETPNEKDYIALQLKLNNDFILQGYSYTTENGVLRCR
ncbi:SdrD B-like domain-containing protein [Clostridium butyricum]|uniref:SdrD B-like domain-containing protein n=2 Tax=Clostridium butyricum TaxID=1492 RepID=UPI000AE0967E|nr:SdrD B-like domain-containing protein [Clostridium butyricum]MCI3008296.1 cna protein B-type domain protein [Clostridium butyricum]MDP0840346.1 SdrD B-like domain-containing protein [Clostridium butyricum]WLS66580.1 SdrD B-like domain-containing protein [Clostridium butyricum]